MNVSKLHETVAHRFSKRSSLQSAYWSYVFGDQPLGRDQSSTREDDLVLTASTGTGKTVGFLYPALARLFDNLMPDGTMQAGHLLPALPGHPRVLIVAPTRELVVQVTR